MTEVLQVSESASLTVEVDGSVEVVWVVPDIDGLEAACVREGVVYCVDNSGVTAVEASTGDVRWRLADGDDALHGSGGHSIWFDGPDTLRVVAPYEYDAVIDPVAGAMRELKYGNPGRSDQGAQDLERPVEFVVEPDLEETVGRWPDGRVAWTLTVSEPMFDEGPAFRVNDLTVLGTSSGELVALRATKRSP